MWNLDNSLEVETRFHPAVGWIRFPMLKTKCHFLGTSDIKSLERHSAKVNQSFASECLSHKQGFNVWAPVSQVPGNGIVKFSTSLGNLLWKLRTVSPRVNRKQSAEGSASGRHFPPAKQIGKERLAGRWKRSTSN